MTVDTESVNDSLSERERHILRDADLCVKCGLCLPHCPTYIKSSQEGESPRGRIALAQGLASGKLSTSARLRSHLSSCLACRACESVCPSRVPYGRLIDAARAQVTALARPGRMRRVLQWMAAEGVVRHPRLARAALRVLSVLQPALASSLAARLMGARAARLLRYLPAPGRLQPWREYYPAARAECVKVALFLGCVARLVDQQTLADTLRVLTTLGCGAYLPAGQGCCGAIYLHDGAPQAGRRLAEANLAAFAGEAFETVVTTASGCGATLSEYPGWPELGAASRDQAKGFAGGVRDISGFLTELTWPEDVHLEPLSARVAVHDPCSLRNVMKQREAPYSLLRRIPDVELVELPGNERCCGAAGTHMLTHAALSDSLARDKVSAFRETGAQLLVTSNVGCALHLRAQLSAAGVQAEVLHPVSLLARQLRAAPKPRVRQ